MQPTVQQPESCRPPGPLLRQKQQRLLEGGKPFGARLQLRPLQPGSRIPLELNVTGTPWGPKSNPVALRQAEQAAVQLR